MTAGTLHIIPVDGEITTKEVAKLNLRDLYPIIDCHCVQRVQCRFGGRVRDLWLDEEGLLRQKPHNERASDMCVEDHYIVGVAVVWVPKPRVKK